MINTDIFYQSLGASRQMGPEEQLMIAEGVRVACEANQWTLVLEQGIQTEDRLEALFRCARLVERTIPFNTRSGWLAIRSPSVEVDDETEAALKRFFQVTQQLGLSLDLPSGFKSAL